MADVQPDGQLQIIPDATTTYTLTASRVGQTDATATLTVTVSDASGTDVAVDGTQSVSPTTTTTYTLTAVGLGGVVTLRTHDHRNQGVFGDTRYTRIYYSESGTPVEAEALYYEGTRLI